MPRRKRKTDYRDGFRQQVLADLRESCLTLKDYAKESGIPERTLHRWKAESGAAARFTRRDPKMKVATFRSPPPWRVTVTTEGVFISLPMVGSDGE